MNYNLFPILSFGDNSVFVNTVNIKPILNTRSFNNYITLFDKKLSIFKNSFTCYNIQIYYMIKKLNIRQLSVLLLCMTFASAFSQKEAVGIRAIKSSDIESYIAYLSSPQLKGRMNGSEGLDMATNFIATEASKIGLGPANRGSFFQHFTVIEKSYDISKTMTIITSAEYPQVNINKPFYQVLPMGVADIDLEGEVVFAGYGINSYKYNYNDLDSINAENKIVMIMNRAPMSEDGKSCLFKEPVWTTIDGLSMKLASLLNLKAKAILVVMDPKSGSKSLYDSDPEMAEYLTTEYYLKGADQQQLNLFSTSRVIIIHRDVADELLNGTGHTLEELQNSIDSNLKPHSFTIDGKTIKITSGVLLQDKILNNVAGVVEGSDPKLKKEVVIFSAHADHIGVSANGEVFTGADDDASGCSSLLALAKAFSSLPKKPLRSVMFLWVSGEEIGLFGSESYANNPLFPIDKTIADINLDMIGRTKRVADTLEANPMSGPNSIFVISEDPDSDLNKIASEIDKKSVIDFDYSLSDKNNPLHLFQRNDQFSFALKNIPTLMFTTGLHTTYHTPDDTVDKIDFRKLELVTKSIFQVGYAIANMK